MMMATIVTADGRGIDQWTETRWADHNPQEGGRFTLRHGAGNAEAGNRYPRSLRCLTAEFTSISSYRYPCVIRYFRPEEPVHTIRCCALSGQLDHVQRRA